MVHIHTNRLEKFDQPGRVEVTIGHQDGGHFITSLPAVATADSIMAKAPLVVPVNTMFVLVFVVAELKCHRIFPVIQPDKKVMIFVAEP